MPYICITIIHTQKTTNMAKRTKKSVQEVIYGISVGVQGEGDNITYEATFKADPQTGDIYDIISYCKDWETKKTHQVPDFLIVKEKQFIFENIGNWEKFETTEDDLEDEVQWTEDDNYQEQYAERNY